MIDVVRRGRAEGETSNRGRTKKEGRDGGENIKLEEKGSKDKSEQGWRGLQEQVVFPMWECGTVGLYGLHSYHRIPLEQESRPVEGGYRRKAGELLERSALGAEIVGREADGEDQVDGLVRLAVWAVQVVNGGCLEVVEGGFESPRGYGA